MPYANDFAAIYRITNPLTGESYIGQSRKVKKRINDHFRLLKKSIHPNPHLQAAYGKFELVPEIEVSCEDPDDMDAIEEAFLQGDAWFGQKTNLYNISSTARAPMQGRRHSESTRLQISRAKEGRTEHVTPEYRAKLRQGKQAAVLSDPQKAARIRYLVENHHLSYAERGRQVNMDTSTARKVALKYAHLKGKL